MGDSGKIDFLLEEIITLPSQPTTLARITDLMNDPESDLSAVGQVISADPSIAIKALRLVNSAHYGLRNRVVSIDHAVMLLGLKVIRNLVLTATVFDTFKSGARELLVHSVACGVALRRFVEHKGIGAEGQAEDVFVYGLLHDVGKIILYEYMPDEMEQAHTLSGNEGLSTFDAERQIIGCDHAEIGARLADKWNLPPPLIDAIAGHHELDRCYHYEFRHWAALLSIADYCCWASTLMSVPNTYLHVTEETWKTADIEKQEIPSLMEVFFASMPEAHELLDLWE